MEAEFVTEGDADAAAAAVGRVRRHAAQLLRHDRRHHRPELRLQRRSRLDQIAPGVYETDLGSLTPGAYALRFIQTKPGETPLARTVMLVAPTPAEYRLLGTNERLLAALRWRDGRPSARGSAPNAVGARPGHDHGRDRHGAVAAAARAAAVAAGRGRPPRLAGRVATSASRAPGPAPVAAVARPRSTHAAGRRDARGQGTCRRRKRPRGALPADRYERRAPQPAATKSAAPRPGPSPATPTAPTAPTAPTQNVPASSAAPAPTPPPTVPPAEPAPTDTIARLREAKQRRRGG